MSWACITWATSGGYAPWPNEVVALLREQEIPGVADNYDSTVATAYGGHQSGSRLILVHGNPVLHTVYWTKDRPDTFARQMAAQAGARAGDVIAFGHTHRPWHREVDGIHFVNTGSVGRPKDGDLRAG